MTTRPGSIPERSTAARSAVAQRSTYPRQLGPVKATKVAQTLAIRLALAGLVLQACRPRSAHRAAARRSVRWCPTRPRTTPACAPATSSSASATRVDAPGDVTEAVLDREPGDRVAVTVQRNGEHRTIEVRLGEQPRRAP
jgi:S1-C subfamily serine protease